jgi:hypothetical protein
VRRLKTYSAQSGYVYQYCYEGQRPFQRSGRQRNGVCVQHVGRPENLASLQGRPATGRVAWWEAAHGRRLSATERYAIAKMALFQAFDERERRR